MSAVKKRVYLFLNTGIGANNRILFILFLVPCYSETNYAVIRVFPPWLQKMSKGSKTFNLLSVKEWCVYIVALIEYDVL